MGYYVRLTDSSLTIPSQNVDTVFKVWCAMNDPKYNKYKRGGGGSDVGGKKTNCWYSWMDEDYDKTCKSVGEILEMLGFGIQEKENGDILITDYDDKTGQEDLFLEVVGHLLEGECTWVGEDDDIWTNKYPTSVQTVLTIGQNVLSIE